LPIIIIIGVDFIMRKMSAVVLAVVDKFNIGKSKAKLLTKNRCKTHFKDVAGLEGAKKRYKKL
jgi:ATP-dependent Zn protease